jgi:hypothetical protein
MPSVLYFCERQGEGRILAGVKKHDGKESPEKREGMMWTVLSLLGSQGTI